jgi:serine/threonine protein kinase
MAFQPGDRFGRYELVSRLGRGGMAETWKARLLGEAGVTKSVLIKKVLPEYANDQVFTSMFISEARISATLSHGNIAHVYDFGRADGEYFLAMEYVDGQPLHRIIKRAPRVGLSSIPVPLAVFIALELCRGLHYAHTRKDDRGVPLGIVHRDISPDNVLISYEGQVKIVDFGIAKARELRGFNTEPGVVKGKFLFFSPEQARGEEVDARTDVWATGIVLYELLCGKLPVDGPQYVALSKIVNGEFPPPRQLNSDLPPELDAIVMKALAVDRERRFESCHAFENALAEFLNFIAPRFSATALAHLVQELFRADLTDEGRVVQVPQSFLEQLSQWRGDALPTIPRTAPVMQTPAHPSASVSSPRSPSASPSMSPRSAMLWGIGAGVGLSLLLLGIAFMVVKPQPPVESEPPSTTSVSSITTPPQAQDSPAATAPAAQAPVAQVPVAQEGVQVQKDEPPTPSPPSTEIVARPPSDTVPPPENTASPANETAGKKTSPASNSPRPSPAPASAAKAASNAKPEARPQSTPPSIAPSPPVTKTPEVERLLAEAEKAYKGKNFAQAAALSDQCLQIAPPYPDCVLLSGATHIKLNQDRKAVAQYREFLRIAPNHKSASQVTDALKVLDTRIAAAEALTFYNEKKYQQALTSALQCITLNDKHADCHMLAGAAYSYLGQEEKTVIHYRIFLELAPTHRHAATVRHKMEQRQKQKSATSSSP